MSQPRVAQSLEHKLRKQASMVADVARLQYKDAWANDSSTRSTTLNGNRVQSQHEYYNFEQKKLNSRDAAGPEVQNVEPVLASESLMHDVSLVNAFSDAEDSAANFYSIEPIPHGVKQSKIASNPLNVTELSPNRSHLMSPPSIRSFSAAASGTREVRILESGSSPLEQHTPRDFLKAKKHNQLAVTYQQLDRPMTAVDRTKPSDVSINGHFSAPSAEDSSSDKPIPQPFHERDLELAAMVGNPAALDEQWKILDQTRANAVELANVRAWCSTQFPGIFNDVAINKAFHLTASSIEGDIKHLVPRRAFKRLLLAIIYINRSLDIFASIDSNSNGNPRISFELFCTAVSKLGSKMDRKRCLFEYQGIHSGTKDYLQIDEFNSWLINSKIIKIQKDSERSVFSNVKSNGSHRFSKSSVIGSRRAEQLAVQKNHQQFINMVASDLSIGDHSSTKKFSIGIVPFKHKIDRLTHDKGPDFFRSTLKANLEAQKKLKDERLDNLAKVAHEQRLRSLPADSNIPSLSSTKNDYATSRASSNIARPKFAKMYEFIDSYLDEKLARMASEAVLSRMDRESQRSRDDRGGKLVTFLTEQQRAEAKPIAAALSMSPAPQPSPLMHSQPPEYPSPNPQLSDISNFENSPDYNSPSRFANIALGWQDTMGLPINLYSEDSPITKALKHITKHLHSSSATVKHPSFAESDAPQQLLLPHQSAVESRILEDATSCLDEYSQMIATTLRALSPTSVSPRSTNQPKYLNTPRDTSLGAISEPLSSHWLHAEDSSSTSERVPILPHVSSTTQDLSFPSTLPTRTVLPDPSDVLTADPKVSMQPLVRFNLFQDIQQEEADSALHLKETSPQVFSHIRALQPQHTDSANNDDISTMAAEPQLPSQALFLQIPELTTSEDDHVGRDILRSSPLNTSQLVGKETLKEKIARQKREADLASTAAASPVAPPSPTMASFDADFPTRSRSESSAGKETLKEKILRQKRESELAAAPASPSTSAVEATKHATITSQNSSPIEYLRGAPASNPQISPQHAQQGSDANDSHHIMRGRISRQKREAIMLEEGIESIRGISELLGMFTSTAPPASKVESPHAKDPVVRTEAASNAKIYLPWELEFNRAAAYDQRHSAIESAHEHVQQSDPSKSRIETLAQLLPEIVVSPETPQLKVNLAANVLRDALPVHGLDLSPNESEIDENAISGDDSEG